MEKEERVRREKVWNILTLIPIAIVLTTVIYDLSIPYIHTPPKAGECDRYIIIDVYGFLKNTSISKDKCYVSGMTLSDFRSLGKVKAREIILVTHFFFGGKEKGLGTSERPSSLFSLIHPISTFLTVEGITKDNQTYIAVSPKMLDLSITPKNKYIVLISCSNEIIGMAKTLANHGNNEVIFSNTPSLSPEDAINLVNKVISTPDPLTLCSLDTFDCIIGGG